MRGAPIASGVARLAPDPGGAACASCLVGAAEVPGDQFLQSLLRPGGGQQAAQRIGQAHAQCQGRGGRQVDLDIGYAGGIEGGGHIPPGNGHGGFQTAPEVDLSAPVAQGHRTQATVLTHLAAQGQRFDAGLGGAWRQPAVGVEAQGQVGGVGQGRLEAGGHAIGGDDVETRTGADHDAGTPGRRVLGMGEGEHRDLAGNVQVVGAARQAGLDHRRTGGGEGAGAEGDHVYSVEAFGDVRGVVQVEDPRRQAEAAAQCLDLGRVAPGEDRQHPLPQGFLGHQLTGVAIGAIDHPGVPAHCAFLRLCMS
ncbi:hypothetical protein D3C72_1232570 [compost metagenome]